MPKVHVDCDEYYPYYSLLKAKDSEDCYAPSCEFSGLELVHIQRVFKLFEEVQALLKDRYEEAERTALQDHEGSFQECPNCGHPSEAWRLRCSNCRYPDKGYTRLEPGTLRVRNTE